jgi:hypothetical protein
MIQGYHQKKQHEQQLQEPPTITMTTAISSYLDKAVISLDDILIGYVKEEEENNKMMMGINDDDDGNKFIIPSCKVISVDKRNTNSLIVDLEYSEAVKYRIFE